MSSIILDRRLFIRCSLAATGLLGLQERGPLLWAADAPMRDFPLPQFNHGDPDTLFLTWQRDPTTTMTVTWVGTQLPENDVQVRVSPLDADSWTTVIAKRTPYPAEGLFVYRAEATGLLPGTQYKFRIGPGTVDRRFQTMPAKASNSFQFVSGGDSGAGDNARQSNLIAARQDPMFVLMAGDIAYDNGVKIGTNLRFLRNYRADMLDSAQRLIPIVPAIGNHETTMIGGRPAAPLFDALYGGLFAEKTYATLDFGDYLSLVLLDTGHMAPIAGEQTSWLDGQLAARTDRPHLIIAQHVPSYPSYRSFDKTGPESRREWVPLFEKHNVDIVLEHHDHTFKRTHALKDGLAHHAGLIYLGDGSWGALRVPRDLESRRYLAAASSNYHVTLHRLEGGQRFHMALTHGGRVIDICTTHKRPRHPMGRGA